MEPASPSPASPDGTRLAFEQTDVDLGTIEPSEGRVLRFPWRRTGVGAITVRRITTGCGCAVAEGLPEVVPPGEAGTMLVRLAGRTRLGPFTVWVRILTDRPPPDDLVRLRVRGFVGRSIAVLPESIDLGPVVPGFAKTLYVSVRPPSGVTVDRVLARLDAIEGTTSVGLPAEADAVGRDVRVSLVAPRATGPFEGALDLVLGDAGLWHVPIRGTVVTPVAGVRR